ncbi:hypothetical protein BDV10DRAFT_59056 [Aspergillus recurvatus]
MSRVKNAESKPKAERKTRSLRSETSGRRKKKKRTDHRSAGKSRREPSRRVKVRIEDSICISLVWGSCVGNRG